MGDEFIAPRELILAGVGLGIALLLLVFLSLLQTSRRRREGADRLRALESEPGGTSNAPPGTTPFFIACFNGANSRFFRVYQGAGELLFVNAGQYFPLIDVESPRGTDQRHWLLRSMKLVGIALAGGAVAAGIGVAAIVRGVARSAASNPGGARDILLMVFGAIGLLALVVVSVVPLMLWQVTRRCRQLDPMSLARLRQEAELDSKSFRATPETIREFKVTLLDQREHFIPSEEVGSRIAFKDSVAGRWKIETKATRDTRDSLVAIRSIWGAGCVTVDPKLRERLGEPADPSDGPLAADNRVPLSQRVEALFKQLDAPPSPNLPRYGFPFEMLVGFTLGAAISVTLTFWLTAGGRFSYTGLVKFLFSLGGLGTYLGHVAGCLRHKELGIHPFGQLRLGILAVGGLIVIAGTMAVFGGVLTILTALRGPAPH